MVTFRKTPFQKAEFLKEYKKHKNSVVDYIGKNAVKKRKKSEENIRSDDTLVSEELNDFLQNATKSLNINKHSYIVNSSCRTTDPADKALNTYNRNHHNILLMKQKFENGDHFLFKVVYISETEKELRELNSNKVTTFGDISTKRCSDTLQKLFHDAVRESNFRDKLKCAEVTPVFKNDGSTKAKNYRSVSVLSGVSKIFERLMHKQISFYSDQFMSPYMCGYKGFQY